MMQGTWKVGKDRSYYCFLLPFQKVQTASLSIVLAGFSHIHIQRLLVDYN